MNRPILVVLVLLVVFFLIGWGSNQIFTGAVSFDANDEKFSPKDRIKSSQIAVYDNMVVLNITNAEWAEYTNTNSMDPLLDDGSSGIEVIPESEDDLVVGDIIVYRPEWISGLVVHRIVGTGEDEEGKYFLTRGDNSGSTDPEKVRFEQIESVLVGIIY